MLEFIVELAMFGAKMIFPFLMICMDFPEGVKLEHVRIEIHDIRPKDLHVLSTHGGNNRSCRLAQCLAGYYILLGVRIASSINEAEV